MADEVYHTIKESTLVDIADAVRRKTGKTDKIVVENLDDEIDSIVLGSGDAADGDVLAGKTYSNDSGASTGTMVNNGSVSTTVGYGETYTIPEGYHNGSGTVTCSVSAGSAYTPATALNPSMNGPTWSSAFNKYLVTASVSKYITPTVNAGYISSGTSGLVSGSNNVEISESTFSAYSSVPSSYTTLSGGTFYKLSSGYYPTDRYYVTPSSPTLSGDATPSDVIASKTFYSDSATQQTGSIWQICTANYVSNINVATTTSTTTGYKRTFSQTKSVVKTSGSSSTMYIVCYSSNAIPYVFYNSELFPKNTAIVLGNWYFVYSASTSSSALTRTQSNIYGYWDDNNIFYILSSASSVTAYYTLRFPTVGLVFCTTSTTRPGFSSGLYSDTSVTMASRVHPQMSNLEPTTGTGPKVRTFDLPFSSRADFNTYASTTTTWAIHSFYNNQSTYFYCDYSAVYEV